MLLKTLLNRVHPVKGFVYERERLIDDATAINGVRIEATLRPRNGSRGVCSGCGERGRTYDTQPARRFDFVPLWGTAVALVYAPRRIDCRRCGVKVEFTEDRMGTIVNICVSVSEDGWGQSSAVYVRQ